MKKTTLQLVIICLVFVPMMFAIPIPQIGYGGLSVPKNLADIYRVLGVMIVLTFLESSNLLDKATTNVIPPCLKNIIGMYMLLGLGCIFEQRMGLINSFSDGIILQLPITMIDVSVLVTVGVVLYWVGGMTYGIMIDLTTNVGNLCWRGLEKVGILDPEEVKETG